MWTSGAVLLVMTILGIYFSREPEIFWVNHSADSESTIVGLSTTDTLIRVAETLLDKQGGYLTNDKLPQCLPRQYSELGTRRGDSGARPGPRHARRLHA